MIGVEDDAESESDDEDGEIIDENQPNFVECDKATQWAKSPLQASTGRNRGEELKKKLMKPQIEARSGVPMLRATVKSAVITCGIPLLQNHQQAQVTGTDGRCHLCIQRKETRTKCSMCDQSVCKDHSEAIVLCQTCAQPY